MFSLDGKLRELTFIQNISQGAEAFVIVAHHHHTDIICSQGRRIIVVMHVDITGGDDHSVDVDCPPGWFACKIPDLAS